MTTKAYSSDLKIRVIKYIEEGNSQKSTCLTFKISSTTVGTVNKPVVCEDFLGADARKTG